MDFYILGCLLFLFFVMTIDFGVTQLNDQETYQKNILNLTLFLMFLNLLGTIVYWAPSSIKMAWIVEKVLKHGNHIRHAISDSSETLTGSDLDIMTCCYKNKIWYPQSVKRSITHWRSLLPRLGTRIDKGEAYGSVWEGAVEQVVFKESSMKFDEKGRRNRIGWERHYSEAL